jgi:hypothetical protein
VGCKKRQRRQHRQQHQRRVARCRPAASRRHSAHRQRGALYARLKALEGKGQVRVLAKPTILTLDNIAAVLDLSQTSYVTLVGERVADLANVTAGTRTESSLNPRAVNVNRNGSYDVGLMQINSTWSSKRDLRVKYAKKVYKNIPPSALGVTQ